MNVNFSNGANNLKSGCSAVIAGLILFIASFFVLWMNESSFVNAQRMAKFIKANVISITNYSPENNRKLVHYSGKIQTPAIMADEYVRINTPALDREVEMYQWKESSTSKSSNSSRKTYRYKKVWSSHEINSANFHDSSYRNPPMNIKSKSLRAQTATIGEFDATTSVINALNPTQDLQLGSLRGKYDIIDNSTLYIPAVKGSRDNVGDYRISYKYIPVNTTVSVISAQSNKTLSAFINSKFNIALTETGESTAPEMIKNFENKSNLEAMMYRGLGFMLMFFGLLFLTSPITTILSFIPFFGDIGNTAIAMVAFILSLVLSVTTIAIAWVAVRPEIAIPVIIAAIAGGMYFLKAKQGKSTNIQQ